MNTQRTLSTPRPAPLGTLGRRLAGLLFVVTVAAPLPAAAADAPSGADWTPLTAEDIEGKGICKALAESSPVKEYYDVDCEHEGEGHLKPHKLKCTPKAELAAYQAKCDDDVLACDLVPMSVTGKTPAGWARMLEGMVLMHDRSVVDANIHLPDYNHYWAGACMHEDNYRFMSAVEALGAAGSPEQAPAIAALMDSEADRKELGKDLRMRIVSGMWWIGGNEAASEGFVGLLDIAHMQRYPGREFREMALMALTQWANPAAESVCADNIRDIKNDADLGACMLYLARQGRKDMGKKMVRQVERAREPGLHALGILGGKEAKGYLTDLRESQGEGQAYVARDVALVNAGDKKAWKSVEATLTRSARPNKSALKAVAFLAGNKKAAKKAIKFLSKHAKAWKKEDADTHALSVAVRAQLGDKKAIKELPKLIDSPDEGVRMAVVKAIGGDFGNVWSGMAGFGIVADDSLLAPLAEAHENESKKDRRERIGAAILNIRAAVRAAAGS